jgi:hypothetical protein
MTLRVASITRMISMTKWEAYRAEADECRRMATKALDPVDRERWLRVASQWLELIPNHSTDVSVVRALTTPEHPEKRPGYLAS